MQADVGEIAVKGYLGESHGGRPWPVDLGGPHGIPAREVLAQLEEQAASGARALLVHLESPGGLVADGFAIADALRAWSRERGPVVVFVAGEVASVAPAIAAAGDAVVADPGAVWWLHSMSGGQGAEAATLELLRRLRARCSAPDLGAWLRLGPNDKGEPNRAELDATAALSWGLADCIGTAEDARRLAAALERPRFEGVRGAKLEAQGTALKVAEGNLQIGNYTFAGRFRQTQLAMAGTAATMTWTFSESEPDTNYAIQATAYNDAYTVPNPPAPIGAFVIAHVAKNVGSAVLTAFTAPGTGATVYWDVSRFRL